MRHKIHKKDLNCSAEMGHHRSDLKQWTASNKEVTCKKCLRLIANEKPKKLYEISFYNYLIGEYDSKIIEAPTPSKAIYKCFKLFMFNPELSENIGIQFQWFRSCKPKTFLTNLKPSMTWDEEQEFKKNEVNKRAEEFNSKYPIGTSVLFQADFTDKVIITTTRSKAQVYSDYLTIFLDGVSGSYTLDERFVRVLTEENKDLERLR